MTWFNLTLKLKNKFLRKQSSKKQSSYSVSYDKEEFQRGEWRIKETSLEPSQKLSKYEHILYTKLEKFSVLNVLVRVI